MYVTLLVIGTLVTFLVCRSVCHRCGASVDHYQIHPKTKSVLFLGSSIGILILLAGCGFLVTGNIGYFSNMSTSINIMNEEMTSLETDY